MPSETTPEVLWSLIMIALLLIAGVGVLVGINVKTLQRRRPGMHWVDALALTMPSRHPATWSSLYLFQTPPIYSSGIYFNADEEWIKEVAITVPPHEKQIGTVSLVHQSLASYIEFITNDGGKIEHHIWLKGILRSEVGKRDLVLDPTAVNVFTVETRNWEVELTFSDIITTSDVDSHTGLESFKLDFHVFEKQQ